MGCVSAQQANPFGQPFLFQIEDEETLDQVKPRIQVSPDCDVPVNHSSHTLWHSRHVVQHIISTTQILIQQQRPGLLTFILDMACL